MTETMSLYGPVATDVSRVGERLRGLANGHHPLLKSTLAYVFETSGKQLRPALVMLSGKLGDYDVDRLVTLAASLEVVHTATLVHDDTIDQALTRRGLKTVSAVWNSKIAILVGDFLFAQSAYLAAQLDDVRIMSLLSETVMAMSTGELRQYSASRTREIDESDYFQRIAGKTASLLAMCCEGAGVVSKQSEAQIRALRSFGTNLGIAFQIVDDVLDFAGDEETLGKPAGSDLREGTITLPAILLAQSLARDDPLRLDLEHGRNIERAIVSVRSSDALDAALRRAREYADAALSALDVFPASEAKDALCQVAERTLSRRR
jgi:geranylgeranyl pyrophosphate synthase